MPLEDRILHAASSISAMTADDLGRRQPAPVMPRHCWRWVCPGRPGSRPNPQPLDNEPVAATIRCRAPTCWWSPGRSRRSRRWPTCSRRASAATPGTATPAASTEHYLPQIRRGAPALQRAAARLLLPDPDRRPRSAAASSRSCTSTRTASRPGRARATLPVKDLFRQMIDEVQAVAGDHRRHRGRDVPARPHRHHRRHVDCPAHELGDVFITRGAKFRLSQEFAKEDFASNVLPLRHVHDPDRAAGRRPKALLAKHAGNLIEPAFGPPHTKYPWTLPGLVPGVKNTPDLLIDGRDFPAFHPILTTDFFEFGTSTNGLEQQGCGVEMGDAVLGLVVEEMQAAGLTAPRWLVIRNASDPQINGKLPDGQDRASRRRCGASSTCRRTGRSGTTRPTATGPASTARSPSGR